MLDQGNTTFVLVMAALVLFMTPGLAFFYGGLVKAKSVISMMMMSFGAIALVSVLWVVYGYAIAFANHGDGTAVSCPSRRGHRAAGNTTFTNGAVALHPRNSSCSLVKPRLARLCDTRGGPRAARAIER